LKFTANWLHEKLFDVQAVTVDVWVFAWLLMKMRLHLLLVGLRVMEILPSLLLLDHFLMMLMQQKLSYQY
jgi:hypothetical protein